MQRQRAIQRQTAEASRQRNGALPPLPTPAPAQPILQLQQTIGNRAVQRLLRSRTIQAKLSISEPGDVYEQEADRVAEHVMRMPEPVIQRTCAACAAGGSRCSKCDTEKQRLVQRETGHSSDTGKSVSDNFLRDLGPGQPLDPATRAYFEPRFGHDFSQVRVHTDAAAAESARALGAAAYTIGRDLFFGIGHYRPQTEAGKGLLAHELTHVLQQTDGAGQSVVMRDTPPSSPTGAPTTGTSAALDPCTVGITETRSEALRWLDEAYDQLVHYEAMEVIPNPPGSPPDPEHERIGRTLQRTFNTRDYMYASVISQRLHHMAATLRSSGVTIVCAASGDRNCSVAGSSFTAAYVARPYAIVMCSVGIAGSRPVATFVHELTHAVVPQVGIRARLTTLGQGVRDRAYEHERLFRYQSPEEALDNADSYGLLVKQLFRRADVDVATSPVDTAPGCTDPRPVLAAVARFEQWIRDVGDWLEALVNLLNGTTPRPFSDLPAEERAKLARYFPAVSTLAGIRDLSALYERMDYALNISHDVACAVASGTCAGDVLGFAPNGSVSGSSIALRRLRAREVMNVCPGWFSLGDDARVSALFALFIVSRPDWMTRGIALREAYQYVNLARDIGHEITPAPTTRGAMEHLLRDTRP